MQDETRRKPGRRGDLLPRLHEDPVGRLSGARPQRKNDDPAGAARELREQHVDPVGAMDKGDAPLRADHAERETDPIAERGVALDRGGGLCRIGDRTAAAALNKGRVRHDMIETPGAEARRRLQQITDHDRQAVGSPVQQQIVAGEPHEIALELDPDDTALRHPRRKAEHRRADTAAGIENLLVGCGGNRGGEKHRVDRGARALGRLAQADAPAEQAVLGDRSAGIRRRTRRIGRPAGGWAGRAHGSPASAAVIKARARP